MNKLSNLGAVIQRSDDQKALVDLTDPDNPREFTFSELQVRQAINEQSIGRWKPFARQLQSLLDALQGFGYLATPSISKNTDF